MNYEMSPEPPSALRCVVTIWSIPLVSKVLQKSIKSVSLNVSLVLEFSVCHSKFSRVCVCVVCVFVFRYGKLLPSLQAKQFSAATGLSRLLIILGVIEPTIKGENVSEEVIQRQVSQIHTPNIHT